MSVAVSTVAWQAAGTKGMLLPSWMGWYGAWTAGWRIALALAAVALVVGVLWWISVKTASKYEARTSSARPALNAAWPLTQPGFWRGEALVGRQRALHAAAACSSAALAAALPAGHPAAARWVAVGFAAAVLAAVVCLVVHAAGRPVHGHAGARGRQQDSGADQVVLGGCWQPRSPRSHRGPGERVDRPAARSPTGALPGLAGFLAVLLAVQAALLIALAGRGQGARPAGPRRRASAGADTPALPGRRARRARREAGLRRSAGC